MISFKKSHAEQLLQLVLTLSLLQVDPDTYLGVGGGGHGWNSQFALRNGDGWQLELLRTSPVSEYRYANRKAMMPLIEDLVRFDTTYSSYRNPHNVTAYLLNIQDGQNNSSNASNGSGGVQEDHHRQEASAVSGVTGRVLSPESPTLIREIGGGLNNFSIINTELDFSLNLDYSQDATEPSILEQNLADLSQYGDIPLSSFPYFGLPLKDEPLEPLTAPAFTDIKVEDERIEYLGGANAARNYSTAPCSPNPSRPNESACISWLDLYADVKVEPIELKDEDKKDILAEQDQAKEEIKTEPSSSSDESKFNITSEIKKESEIVEVLWKQDVDLGYSLTPAKISPTDKIAASSSSQSSDDDNERLKALEELKEDKLKESKDELPQKDEFENEWAGIHFTIDNETGEYIQLPLQLDEILQDVLQLADLTGEQDEDVSSRTSSSEEPNSELKPSDKAEEFIDSLPVVPSVAQDPPESEIEVNSSQAETTSPDLFDLDNESDLDDISMMIQSAGPFHHQHHRSAQNYGSASNSAFRQSTGGFHHHHHHQTRVPLTRGVTMEQRLQDIANLFTPIPGMGVGMGVGEMSPYTHYPTHYPYQTAPGIPPPPPPHHHHQHAQFGHHPSHHPVLHNASLADLGTGVPAQPHYGHNLGSAVSSSMHLTNSSHEGNDSSIATASAAGYKMEHDMMYYSNTTSELNHTTDGFINSILNDEDLQLMDMGVNESFCGMRMLDSNATSNTSSVLGSSGNSGGSASSVQPHAGSSHLLSSSAMPNSLGGTSGLGSDGLGSTGDRLDASSDSAVSSMGSERVPSLSDGEWGDAGSDSAQDYHQGKYGGPYDYSYHSRMGDSGRQPVAQKKHQMFGKRYFQEQPNLPTIPQPSQTGGQVNSATGMKYDYESYSSAAAALHHHHQHSLAQQQHQLEGAAGPSIHKDHHVPLMTHAEMKYGCSLDFTRPPRTTQDIINHNHTYSLPQGPGSGSRPQLRDKRHKHSRSEEDQHLTRDEKRARALHIPIAVHDIINLPMDEFNERLSKYDLSENQLSLIRDVRRRGKNKVAAQNCRKRKLDQILSLEDEVREVRRRKDSLYRDRDFVINERKRIASKFATLHRHVFQYLRDPDGNPCSPTHYSLQQAADGSVYLLRRENSKNDGSNGNGSTSGNSSTHHHQQGPTPPHHQKE